MDKPQPSDTRALHVIAGDRDAYAASLLHLATKPGPDFEAAVDRLLAKPALSAVPQLASHPRREPGV